MISEWRPLMLSLLTASSPACVVLRSISSRDRFTYSSMLAGWILPSRTSASRALRAISRRTGSNDERRDLAPHGVERREEHELGRLVDQQRDARRGLERLDVAAL